MTIEKLYDTTGAAAGLSACMRSIGAELSILAADSLDGITDPSMLEDEVSTATAELMEEIRQADQSCDFWAQHYGEWKPSRSLLVAKLDAMHFADMLAAKSMQVWESGKWKAHAADVLEFASAMSNRDHAYRVSLQDVGEGVTRDWSMCPAEEWDTYIEPEGSPASGPPRDTRNNVVQLAARRRRPARTSTDPAA